MFHSLFLIEWFLSTSWANWAGAQFKFLLEVLRLLANTACCRMILEIEIEDVSYVHT